MNAADAADALHRAHIPPDANFFTLTWAQVDALLAEADRVRYRKPRNANGSRARYFHARCIRAIERGNA